jgi:integrase
MPTQLPSGRWRTRVRHPRTGRQLSARAVIGGPDTYATRDAATAAEDQARRVLRSNARVGVTVAEFWQDWTADPLWLRPAESTNIHNRERTSKFVAAHGDLPLRSIGDEHVAAWLRGGRNRGTVPALRAFFNDAASAPAGRLVDRNPFAKLGLRTSRGRRDTQPPGQVTIARFVALAGELTPPSFAAYLDTAVHEGMRPGELDALRWTKIDFQAGTILVDEQWNAKARAFTLPKHGVIRTVALAEPARERLLALPRESEFVFTTLRGTPLPALLACPPLEPRPLRGRVRQRRPVHGHPSLLRLVRVERAGPRRPRHRAPLRPPGRRPARAQAVRAPRREARPRARP